jgi:hypothetical protein
MNHIWESIKDRASCLDLAAEAGVETSKGKTVCPFCHYQTPSFHVETEYFRCHHCGKRGDAITLWQELNQVSVVDAAKALASRLGLDFKITKEEAAKETRSELFRKFADKYRELPAPAREYLHGRGLTDDFISRASIGYVPADAPDEQEQELRDAGLPYLVRGRILIPFMQGRHVVYFTGRTVGDPPAGQPKFKNQKGPKTYIGTMRGPELWITEGIFDQLLLEQAGVNAIGIAGSSATFKLHQGIKRVVLAMDNDKAGQEFTSKHALGFHLGGAAVDVVCWPEGVKDMADYLAAGGKLVDLARNPLRDLYWDALSQDKDNPEVKRDFYRIIERLDPIKREKEMKLLGKLWGVSMPTVKADMRDYLQEFEQSEFLGEEGVKFAIPEGYRMSESGVSKSKELVTATPLYIDAVGRSQHSREEYVRLRFNNPTTGSHSTRYVSMMDISSSSDVVKLSRYGVPANSGNQISVIRWLEAWMARNRDKFSQFEVVQQLGWIGPDFLLPDRIIRLTEDKVPVPIQYIGTVPEDAYATKGTVAGWTEAMRLLAGLPGASVVRFMVYAAFASAVLEPLNLRPFIIHLHGDTSEGKTTALKVAASVYGRPDFGGAMLRWNNTETFILRYCEQLHNVPLCIDELSGETKKNFDALVYQLEGGIAKGKADRHDPNAVHRQRTFRLGVFSSGETMMLNDRSLGGAQIRVWEIAGSPFGGQCKALVQQLEKGIAANHGVALEHFLRNFLANRDTFDDQSSFYCPGPGSKPLSNVEERMLRPLSRIWIIGEAVNIIFDLGFPVADDMQAIFEMLRRPVEDSARTVDKLLSIISDHYQENKISFPTMRKDAVTGKNVPVFEGGKPPSKIFGYRFDNDLGIIKRHFMEFVDESMGRVNGGQYAINRLTEKGLALPGRVKRRVDSDLVAFVMLPHFFADDPGCSDEF